MEPHINYRSVEGYQQVMDLYAQTLSRWPVPYQALTLPTRHGETFLIASGPADAPALILLHGSCSNATAWFGDVVEFSRRRRVYAVDLPGEPGKSSPNRPSWEGPAIAEWLEDVLDGLGLAQAAVLGISQGGWTALRFATLHPERVERLVLLAPGGVAPVKPSFLLRAILLSMLGRRGGEAINRITFGNQPIHPDAVTYMNLIMTHFKPRIGAQAVFSDAELSRLNMPTLLCVGQHDALLPSEKTSARLSALLPHLKVILRADQGHVLHGMASEIVPFLDAPSV